MTHARDVPTQEGNGDTSPRMRHFIGLVTHLCRKLGGDPERVLMGESLHIAGMDFCISYLEAIDPEWLVLSATVMEVPPEHELDICLNALEWNNGLYDGHAPVLALDAERKHILSLARLRLELTEAESLYLTLQDMAAMIPEWAQLLSALRGGDTEQSFDAQWLPGFVQIRS